MFFVHSMIVHKLLPQNTSQRNVQPAQVCTKPYLHPTNSTPMESRTLEHLSVANIATAFNRAFADYSIKLEHTEASMQAHFAANRIAQELSLGAFDGEVLAGFILHGVDVLDSQQTAYNAGTGVLPNYRGRALTKRMYQHVLPLLKAAGCTQCVLEVIQSNTAAIKAYEATGFHIARTYPCFRGEVEAADWEPHTIVEVTTPNWDLYRSFWDWKPSWQNSPEAIALSPCTIVEARDGETVLGYAVFLPEKGRVVQWAVHPEHRRKGIGTALYHYAVQHSKGPHSVVNVQGDQAATIAFLNSLGFTEFVAQYEMYLSLENS